MKKKKRNKEKVFNYVNIQEGKYGKQEKQV